MFYLERKSLTLQDENMIIDWQGMYHCITMCCIVFHCSFWRETKNAVKWSDKQTLLDITNLPMAAHVHVVWVSESWNSCMYHQCCHGHYIVTICGTCVYKDTHRWRNTCRRVSALGRTKSAIIHCCVMYKENPGRYKVISR